MDLNRRNNENSLFNPYTTLSFSDYYRNDFIDPLYRPYLEKRQFDMSKSKDLLNQNEIRRGWGRAFRLKSSRYPCPFGYKKGDFDWCYPMTPNEPIFYSNNYKNILNNTNPILRPSKVVQTDIPVYDGPIVGARQGKTKFYRQNDQFWRVNSRKDLIPLSVENVYPCH